MAIQAITIAHDRLLATRTSYTWVHKYIFPGGVIPSVRAIEDITEKQTGLRVRERLAMGEHYAQTLRLWEERFMARAAEVRGWASTRSSSGCGCSTCATPGPGFETGYLDVQQIVLDRRRARHGWLAFAVSLSTRRDPEAALPVPASCVCPAPHSPGHCARHATRRLRRDTRAFKCG